MSERGVCGRAADRANVVGLVGLSFLTLLFIAILGRVVQLQVAPDERLRPYLAQAETRASVPSIRGEVRDRRGRVLATSRLGYRVFVDPEQLGNRADEVIGSLAAALDVPADEIGQKLITRLAENASRRQLLEAGEPIGFTEEGEPIAPKPLIRYVPIDGTNGRLISEAHAACLAEMHLPGVHIERPAVREASAAMPAAPLVGKVGFEHVGLVGAEHLFEAQLTGHDGSVGYARDAWGRALWVEPGAIEPASRGEDVRLSIDIEIQRICRDELVRGVEEADAAGGRLVAVDPNTGEILAMVDVIRPVPGAVEFPWHPKDQPEPAGLRPWERGWDERPRYVVLEGDERRAREAALARHRCVEDVYEPGSTFKPFVWSLVTERGLAMPDEVFDTEGGFWKTAYGRPIRDVSRRDTMTWHEVLVRSSNVGMVKGAERLTFEQLRQGVLRYGFGSPTGIGLPGETAGLVTSARNWTKYTQTSVAFGYEVAVTPVQMVRAFSVFAREGRLASGEELAGTLTQLTLRAAEESGSTGVVHRVIPPEVARLGRDAMAQVAANMETVMAARYPDERDWDYAIFGKSGTAKISLGGAPEGMRAPAGLRGYFPNQYHSSFIAAGPLEQPAVVVITVIDDPGPQMVRENRYYGSQVAGPVVRRSLERVLAYLGVEPDEGDGGFAEQGPRMARGPSTP